MKKVAHDSRNVLKVTDGKNNNSIPFFTRHSLAKKALDALKDLSVHSIIAVKTEDY